MTSVSSGGGSVITLEFNLDENIDVAEQEVQEAINCRQHVSACRPANPPSTARSTPPTRPS